MRSQYLGRTLLATVVVVSLLVPGALVGSQPANAAEEVQPSPAGCADMTVPEENHASIRLRVDEPASEAQVPVDEHGKIAIGGILHKQAAMVDVSDEKVTSSDFTLGPPPEDVAAWAASWSTSLRPPHLGANEVCARAEREPKRSARILRSFTVVDLIPPSDVPGLAIGSIGATTATVTWGEATDNYGLAGYEVTVDGGAAQRTTVGTRSYKITGLAPSTSHTVSVVAIDLAGNTSKTPATASFTTDAAPPPPEGDLALAFDAEQGAATVTWHPDLPADVTYRVFLDDEEYDEFPLAENCLDDTGKPAKPCTPQDAINYLIEPLEGSTQYEFRVDALHADGTVARSLSGSFTTTKGEDVVSPATTQLTASESSRCAGMGGDFYVAADARAGVPVPAGSTQVFEGCYTVANSSCIDAFLPPSGEQILDCVDNLTDLLLAVAPPGRGPVISSFNDVVAGAPAPGQKIQIEPITWCQDDSCVVLFAPSPATAKVLEVAGKTTARTAFLVVSPAGIGIGIALGALLVLLWPGDLGIYGLLEYPINIDTDFDAFDNWGADEGEWYNSLKMYAEVVKTTDQIAGKHNIPFAWAATDDAPLKRAIDGACSAQQGTLPAVAGCSADFAVYVPGAANYKFNPMPQTGNHIVTAMGGNNSGWPQPTQRAQWFAPEYSKKGQAATNKGYDRKWYDRPRKHPQWQPNACTGRIKAVTVCDEFPFWSTNQAVDLSGIVASVEPVPKAEGSYQGTDLAQFYDQCSVDDTDQFIVLPVKPWVDAGGPSFGFRVTSGAASLCLVPDP
ncbi:fibronectin type III domain-containing protein [Arthrobacter rhizosphaerae]|uniref:fibronectin type III domain-containing protein n=1 Tax=Arthrobacter rhizosphaerae TaxID=2855490 RepID=UPI001FF5AB20|nr:hypothetical protein [Arthrobacter rhizosphaerae]